MILGFQKQINGKPTFFREKILSSLGNSEYTDYTPKLHTIREDKPDRWNDTRIIQFVTRGKNFSCEKFAEMPCTGIQRIEIKYIYRSPSVFIDRNRLNGGDVFMLAINDGFANVEHFFNWFKEDFRGKIIHWTGKRY